MQQQDEEAVSDEENGDTSETEKNELGQENSNEKKGPEGTQGSPVVLEGMRTSEAQLLLDSLRNDEQLLPFTQSSETQGNKGETRDW
ncbi:MAG: hypothetical protein ACJAUA_000331 [Zhongshania aliphaticivorans]|jgi:hypothetical protein